MNKSKESESSKASKSGVTKNKSSKAVGRPPTVGSQRWIELNGINGVVMEDKTFDKLPEKPKKVSLIKKIATLEDYIESQKRKEVDTDSDYEEEGEDIEDNDQLPDLKKVRGKQFKKVKNNPFDSKKLELTAQT